MKKFYPSIVRQGKEISCALLGMLSLLMPLSPVKAEGSKELAARGGYRAYMNSTTVAGSVNIFPTLGTMKVYVKAGERLYLGSSAQGIGNGTMRVRLPNGTTFTTGNSTTVGRIVNRTQEVNGPNLVTGSGSGYNAFIRTVAASEAGVWEIDFVPPNVNSTTSPTATLASASWTQPSTTFVTAFDITVVSASNVIIPGRAYTNIFTANMGNYQYGFNGLFNVLTNDGYLYTVDNNGQTGFGFSFFANNKGPRNAAGDPLYKSVDVLANANVHDPRAADTETDVTHKLFFNTPNADLPASANSIRGEEWLRATPPALNVTVASFRSIEGTSTTSLGTYPLGGNFTFTAGVAGNFAIDLDLNANGSFTDAVDRRLTGNAVAGTNTVYWDGLRGDGTKMPATTTGTTTFTNKVQLFGGEVHFPFIDVENNVNGIIITRVGGDNLVNWDDTPITVAGTPSNPRKTTDPGVASTSNGHKWGSTSYGSADFGDEVLLDTWAYVQSSPSSTSISFVLRESDLEVVSISNPLPSYCVGQNISFTVVARNNGPNNVAGGAMRIVWPAEFTNVSVSAAATGTASVVSPVTGATQYNASVNMNNGALLTFTVSGTVGSLPAGGNIVLTGSIMRPADVTDPDATNPDVAVPTDPQAECDAAPSGAGCNNIKAISVPISALPTQAVAGPAQVLCAATTVTLAGNTPTAGTGTWTKVSGPGTQVITSPNAPGTTVTGLTTGTYVFRWTIANGNCTPTTSDVTITVLPAIAGNTIAAPATNTFCASGDAAVITGSTPTGGTGTYTYEWMVSADNITFTPITGATSASYDPPAITATTYYRRSVTSGACATAVTSNVVTITVQPAITNNIITAPATTVFCEIGNAAVITGASPTGGNGTFAYQWQSSPDNNTWTNITGATAATYDPVQVSATQYYRRTATSGACSTPSVSNVVAITVNPAITAGTVEASQTFCTSGNPALFTQTTAPTGGNGTYTYQWQSSTSGAAAGFTDISGATAATYDAPVLTQTTWYRRITRSAGCADAISNVITVTIWPTLVAGSIGSSQTFCGSGDPVPLTQITAPTGGSTLYVYQWQSSVTSATAGFSDIAGAASESYDPGVVTQTTYYRRIVRSDNCAEVTSNAVTITVTPGLDGNTITADQTVCTGTAPATLTGSTPTGGNGTYAYLWESSTTGTAGFAAAPGVNTGQNYTPPALTASTIYRRRVTSGICGASFSNIVQIAVTAAAPVAAAGPDQGPLNAATITLAANASGSGAGQWSQVSGPNTANIIAVSEPNTDVGGLIPGTYVFRWTISNAPCASTSDNVTIIINAPPVAGNDAATTPEDVAVIIPVLGNDSDADGTITAGELVTPPANGTLVLNANNTVTYTPRPNFFGTDAFTYQIRDNLGTVSNTATVTITVTPVNDVPVAGDDNINLAEDTQLNLPAPGVLDNDSDADGGTLAASLISGPVNGTLTLNSNGSLSYLPRLDFTGPDQFTYRVCDGTGLCDTATVTINVGNLNDAPVAAADAYSVNEDTELNITAPGVLANDTDADGDVLTANLVSSPAHGTLQLLANGSFRYVPAADYNGPDNFTYNACDASGACTLATVNLTVTAVNDKPVAGDDGYNGQEDVPLTVTANGLLFNDSDPDNNTLTASVVTQPANGTVTINANGTFTYTPALNFNGIDNFTYRICDNGTPSLCDTATVTLTIAAGNDPPVAVNDAYTTAEDNPLSVNAPGILANDSDIDSDVLTASILTQPANGTVTLNANGSFVYTPNPGYNGSDAFTYRVCDALGGCDTGSVAITVTPVNDKPVTIDATYNATEDGSLTVGAPGILLNDRDPDGDPLTASLITATANGTIVLNPNGSFTYTPNPDFNGTDRFTYRACDNGTPQLCDTAEITFNVAAVNDKPTGTDDTYTVAEDGVLDTGAPGVLANDTDTDGDILSASILTGPIHGTIALNANGSFRYVPAQNYNGTDLFIYRVCDNSGSCDTVTANLTITAVNDAPISADDVFNGQEDAAINIPAAGGVLFNDADPDGDALTVSVVTPPAGGTLTLNPNGSFTYTPVADFNGVVSFTYRACDAGGLCDTATVQLRIANVNDAPVTGTDSYTVPEDGNLVIAPPGLLVNDTDADGDALTTTLQSQPQHGTIVINPDGSFVYRPVADYNGPDSFTYLACDNTGACVTGTVNLTVSATNDRPEAQNDVYQATEDVPLNIAANNVLFNDRDIDGDALTASIVTPAPNGTVILNSNGTFTYTPNLNFNGRDSIFYRACDPSGTCDTAIAVFIVAPAPDAPVATDDAYTLNEDTPLTVALPGLLANDADVDGDPLSATVFNPPANGTVTVNPDGSFTYTPNADFNGTDAFTYRVCDNGNPARCDTGTVRLTINAVNDAPRPADDNYTVGEDAVLNIPAPGILQNDREPDGQPVTITIVTNQQHGTLSMGTGGAFIYTPASNYTGIDSFVYRSCDALGLCDTAIVRIVITPENDAPVAGNDAFTLAEDGVQIITLGQLLANDTDPDGDQLQISNFTQPANGTIVRTTGAGGEQALEYRPRTNYNGTDQFTYTVCDPGGTCTTGTVALTITPVNDPVIARNDEFKTPEDTAIVITFAQLLANDFDVEGESLIVTIIPGTGPVNGTIDVRATEFTYDPNNDVTDTDSIKYSVCEPNGGFCDTATIYIRISNVNDPPVPVADSYTVQEDSVLNIAAPGVLGNDTDPDNDQLTAVILTGPTNGTVTLQADGSFQYVPNANYFGTDQFTYNACDIAGVCVPATVTITITSVNDAPVAVADIIAVSEDVPVTGNVTANDTDIENNTLTAEVVTIPAHGTLVINADGSFTYTPNLDFNGTDVAVYRICDNGTPSLCDTATLQFNITEANDNPVARADVYSTSEDSVIEIGTNSGVLGNDIDPDGDALSASLLAGPLHGTVTLASDGSFRYQPAENYFGRDTFTYRVCDVFGACAEDSVFVNISPVNDKPLAMDDVITLNEEQVVILNPALPAFLLVNDSDPDGDALTATPIGTLAHGTLVPNGDGTYTYTPEKDYVGFDYIYYQLCDNGTPSLCDTAFVTIRLVNVNDAPVARRDSFIVSEDLVLTVPAAEGVLANDTDIDDEALVTTVVTTASGTLNLNPNGSFRYQPNPNFNGVDSFTYRACDAGGQCSTAVAKITVQPVNDPPIGVDDAFTRAEDTTITFTGAVALINDSDPDGDVLSGRPIGSLTKGTFTTNPDGSYTYKPAPNFNGVDSIEYQVCDPGGLCDTAIIRVTIEARNDAPAAHATSYSLKEDTPLEIPVPGLLANSVDADGDNMVVSLLTPPLHGQVVVRPDGSFQYTPDRNFNGLDTFRYQICDPSGACDSASVYLTIEPQNDVPEANSDLYSTSEDAPLSIPSAGVLTNDTDPDGDALTAEIVTAPTRGTVTIQPDGSFLYTPAPDYNGPDEFIYRACDGLLCDEATVRIDVLPVKDVPVAVNDTLTLVEDTELTNAEGILRNDQNTDQSLLNVTIATPPTKGTLTVSGNGRITYRPGLNQFGLDSAEYRICNIDNDCSNAKIYFNITPVNDNPIGVDDNFVRSEDTVLTFPPTVALINDIDPDGDVLTGTPIGQLTKGTFVRNPDGTYTYTPLRDFHGVDSIEYEVCDPSGLCDTAIIRITLLPVNDKPVAVDDTFNVQEDEALSIAAPGFMGNDTDVDGDPLNFSLLDGPGHGTITVSTDGSVLYQPEPDYTGRDTLRYIVADGAGLTDTATVYIIIAGVNDKPVALDNAYSLNERTTVTGNVMTDDSDPDGNALTASLVTGPVNGNLIINPDGSFTYVPNAGFLGLDSAMYRICDNGSPSLCDTARISFIVNDVNDAPVAVDDAIAVTEELPATGNVLTNDTDPEGDGLTASLVTAPVNGTVVFNADGSFTYTPNANYNGLDSLIYQVCDNGTPSLCDTAVVRFTVTAVNDAPVAVADAITVTEGQPATGNVLTNDSDPEGDALTASLVTAPVNGTVVLNADGSFTYTPNANYNGLDSLIYQVCDNVTPSLCDTAVVRFTVTAVNDAPIAVADAVTVAEGVPATGNVLTNDSDPEGDALTASLVTAPVNGTVVLNADGSFTYSPNANYSGLDSLTYQVCDNGTPSLCDTAVVRFTITAVNDAPIAVADAITVAEGVPATGNVLTNDSDPEGDALTASLVTAPVNGTVVLNADGSFTYTPNANYNGLDSLIYQVCDNDTPSLCDTAVVRFTVTAVNDAPVAVADAVTVAEGVPATGNVLTNDSDPEGDALTASLVTAPVNGTVVLNADGSFTYTPNANYSGLDSLVYQVCDNGTPSLCDTAVVRFTVTAVNDAPIAVADAITVTEEQPATGNVLTNDSDPEGDALTASLVTAPVNGTVVLNADGSFTYTPNANYSGLDSLVYQVCDNGTPTLCDTAVVRFTVTAVNDAPVAVADAITVTEGQPATGNVLTNDSDPEGDALTASLVTAPVNGTAVLNADGSFTYTPNANFNGLDSLVYQVCDNGTPSLCDTAVVRFTVTAVNDAPIAVADAVTVAEGVPATGNVLTNDSDPEGDGLTASLVTAPVNGTVVLNADGSFTYTPNANFNGLDSLVYQVCDNGTPSLCDTAVVRFTVTAVNDAPIAVADTVTVTENQLATGNVLANDSDPEGDALTASLVTAPVNGAVVLNADGSFTYTPNANYNGLDSLIYQVCDNGTPSLCDTAVVRFTVTAVNDAPIAVADAVIVTENQPATGNVLANDSDPEGDALTASLVTAPVNGTVVLNSDGSFTYTPNSNYSGLDSLIYQVCDNGTPSLCDTAVVRFTITAVNDAPIAVADAVTVAEGVPATGNVLTNDSDPEGDGLTASLVTAPVNGTVVLNADGSFTYTPNANYSGLDSLVYQVCDNGTPSLCDTAVVRFTVTAVNDAPIAVADAITVTEGQPATGNILTNDSDPEGDALTASLVTAPVNGTVVLNADGSFTYTPNANYNGLDSLIYQVCDNGTPSLCDTAVVRFTVTAVNDAPIAVADAVTVAEGVPATGNVLTNDSDPEGDALTASLVTAPVNGTVVLNADGSFTYTPNANYSGLDSLIYQVCDNGTPSLCDTAVVRFTVTAVNDAPVAVADAITVTEGQPATGNVLTNDSDPEGDALTASLVTAPVNGTVVLNADGSFTYTPNANYSGLDSLIYQVCDNGTPSLCDTAVVRFTITAVNDAPIAVADAVTVAEGVPATGNVLTNDSDPEGDALTASLVTAPVNGTVVLNADGSFTYTPNSNYSGLDSLIYQVCDNGTPSMCDTAVVRFTVTAVNDAPIAVADAITVTEGQPATGNILTNDSDPEVDALTASLVTAPVNGTVVLNADGSFTYTPNANYNGLDSLIYQVCDNGTPSLCDTAVVRFTVTAVNDAPIAVADAVTVTENQPATGNVLANDSDPEGDALTASLVTAPVNGTVVLNADGFFTYTPNANYNGLDSLVYQVCDNGTPSLCDTAVVRFTVTAVNDAPIAVADAITVTEGQPATGNVLTNDSDPEGDALTASLLTAPVNGTVVLNADGSFTYTPNANYNGLDSMIYQVCDNGTPSLCDTAVVRFTVTAVNDAPIAVADAITVTEGQPATGNILTNDSDPEGDALTASLVTAPVNGTVVLNADGSFTYTPNSNYSGLDSLIYQVCDNGTPSRCDTAAVRFTVTAVNDAPIAVADAVTVAEGVPATGNVLTNDSDPEGDALTASLVTAPVNGTVVLNADGSFTYTPNANFNGLDSLVYQICDNGTPSLCDTAVVRFTITAVNDAPIAVADAIIVTEEQSATGNVLTNDSDPEGDALTASLVTAPVNGTVVLNADGSFTYTPNANYNGLDSLIYQVCDNGIPSLCDTAVVRFTVTAVNDAPIAVADAITVTEEQPATGNVLTNDTDPEGDALTASLITAPVNGTVVLNADGSFTYTPNANYNGLDSMIYQVCDNGTPSLCDTAVVRFTVTAVNDAPIAVADAVIVTENQPATGNVLTNDSDPEGDALTASLITAPVNGTVVLNADGSFTYTPNANYNGLDSLIYQVCDNGTPSLCDTAVVRFTVTAVNDAPVALADAVTVAEGVPATGNVLTNDSDPEGDELTASLVTAPVNGTVVLNADGSFTYTPNANYSGLDSLIYQVCDNGTPSLCDTAVARFTISAVNEAPIAQNDSTNTLFGQPVTYNVISNDEDPDNDVLSASIVKGPSKGQATITTAGAITYTPGAGFTGRDTVTYRICDNGTPVLCDTAFFIVVVAPPAENPAAALAKAADAAVLQTDGSYFIRFVFTIRNTGNTDLKDVMIGDNLQQTLPAPTTWTVESITASGNLVANPQFNGASDTSLLQILSTLDRGDRDSVALVLRVRTNGSFGPFFNRASFEAKNVNNNSPIRGASKPGRNPDANTAGPTAFSFQPLSLVGLAKSAAEPKLEIDGSYTVVFTFFVRNMGNTALSNVRLTDDLVRVFPAPQSFRIIGNVAASGSLVPNQGFNGSTEQALLTIGSTIAANREDTVRVTVNIRPNKTFGTYNNVAEVRAEAAGTGDEVSDVSTNGNLADPNNNGRPDESTATPIVLSPTSLRIPGGFSPNGDGLNDRFVIGNIGSDKIFLEVYNRWGNVVYKASEYKNDWNGTCNLGLHFGENLPDGTYYYIVVNQTTGEKYINYLTIIR